MKSSEWELLLLDAAERVRRKVAPLAREGGRGRTVGIGAGGDHTIYADKVAENELLRAIGTVPEVHVLSEEAGSVGDPGHRTLAIIDPLDGSSNFERGIPFYCTSVAIAEGDSVDDIVAGVVENLVTGDVYTARRGRGARKNGRPIRTSATSAVSAAVVGIDLSRGPPGLTNALAPLLEGAKRQVHLGANALELCYTAEGKTDAFVEVRGKTRIVDFAAAYLIALEAGAKITDPAGKELHPRFDLGERFGFVASANGTLHKEILRLCGGRA